MIPVASFDRWYFAKDKKKVGPVSLAQLRSLLAAGELKSEDMVLQEGTTKWRPLAEVAGLEIPGLPSDCWYYAQNKKKMGPVTRVQLRQMLAEGVLKPDDMVFQEAATKWRPLAEVVGVATRALPINMPWTMAFAGGSGIVILAFLVWGLVALLNGMNRNKEVENPGPVAVEGVSRKTETDAAPRKDQTPQPPGPQEQDESGPPDDAQASARQWASLVLQLGHSGIIRSVAFSPDGKQVLTGSHDNTARLWDVGTGREIRAFSHTDQVTSVAFSPDGKQALTGSHDKTARLWDVATGREVRAFQSHTDKVLSVAFSPDGKQALTGSDDKTARLWDVATGAEIWAIEMPLFQGRPRAVTSVAFFPDGKQVLTGSCDATARSWDTNSHTLIKAFAGHVDQSVLQGDTFISVAVSQDGKQILTSYGSQMRLWNTATGKEIRAFRHSVRMVTSVAFAPDGMRVLSGSQDHSVVLWNAATGRKIRAYRGSPGYWDPGNLHKIEPVAFSPNGEQVLAGGADSKARLWDAATGREIWCFQGQTENAEFVAFSPDGKQVLTGNGDADLSARLWDVVGGKRIRTFWVPGIKFPPAVSSVAFSRDGKQVLMGNSDNTARLWDAGSGKQIGKFSWKQKFVNFASYSKTSVAFSPDGKHVLTGHDQMSLWDTATGKETLAFRGDTEVKGGTGVACVAFSPNGKQVLTGGADTRMVMYRFNIKRNVVVGTLDTTARLWNAVSGEVIRVFRGHTGGLNSVAFSPDGKQVLTGSDDGTARLWDVASGMENRALPAHSGKVGAVAFSPDGTQVLTGTGDLKVRTALSSAELGINQGFFLLRHLPEDQRGDYTIRLWDTATGKEIRALRGHTGGITSMVFSPDGKQVLSGSEDHTVRLWDTASGRELCQFISFKDNTWVAVTPDNHYMASRGTLEGVTFRIRDRSFSFDQFDLKFNRPDKVIKHIGLASPKMIAAYRQAYQKRLKRMNFSLAMLGDDFHVPEIAISADAKLFTREKALEINVKASDSKYLLDRLHVNVNGIPLYGTEGISLRKRQSKAWQQRIEVELSAGKNKIDVSVLNEKGAESFKETISINHDTFAAKPNLYVVAVGVSDYSDTRFRLTYADKDARDLADLFESKRDRFGEVKVLRILNRDATRENILKAKDFLKTSRVDDLVVVFFAGHGLLDSKFDYYFATADIDFKDPAKRGLPYEAIEGLLDGIRARKKLLLMDTCHSGELDKDEVRITRSEKQPEGEIKVRSVRGLDFGITPKVGLGNSYQLLQEMFADLRRGTGAVVIASAGGAEYALESATWKNGVFTHALLRGLKGEADRNKDGRVQVSELRDFVEQEVNRLTQGRQTPTARRENLVVDFSLD